jgi:hypothetical protein
VNQKLFEDLSRTIALKDRGFFSASSSLSRWTAKMKAKVDYTCSISWILLYRASISGYRSFDFHRSCDGMGKCVVVIEAENGRIAVAYNEDGFTSGLSRSRNINGFVTAVGGGRCGEIFIEIRRNLESSIILLSVLFLGDTHLIFVSRTIVTSSYILLTGKILWKA